MEYLFHRFEFEDVNLLKEMSTLRFFIVLEAHPNLQIIRYFKIQMSV